MAPSSPSRVLPRLWLGALIAAVALVALLPWWRNRAYLRDFYDYGLVMAGNGRILHGERPYVDFTTPIQSATFLANLAAEQALGGTYVGMTGGLAVAIVVAAVVFTLMLARRWPAWLAAVVAAAVILGSLAQHTILWHNTMGVAALAVVAWGGAIAPVVQRRTWPWHLLAAAGLVLGGINKLNFHLLAMAVAVGWTGREVLAGRAAVRQLVVTALGVTLAGVVVPVALELEWTRASLGDWWRNVIAVPLASRGGDLGRLAHWKMLWEPVHDYYGPLWLRPVGAFIVSTILLATAGVWRRAAGERPVLAATALLGLAGALGLYATNYEIGYVAAAAALVLACAIVLGFGGGRPGPVVTALLALAALAVGIGGGESAWRGQRSQFGHAGSPRSTYAELATTGDAFGYFRGLHVPREWVDPAQGFDKTLPPTDAQGQLPVFYGQGMEWLERVYPARKHQGLPLWMHIGTSYGEAEVARLGRLLADDGAVVTYYGAVPWHYLPEPVAGIVRNRFERVSMPGYMARWIRTEVPETGAGAGEALPPARRLGEILARTDGIDAINALGCNLHPFEVGMRGAAAQVFPRTPRSGPVLGVDRGRAAVLLPASVHHFRGEIYVRRIEGDRVPVHAGFAIRHHETRASLWCSRLALATDADERSLPVDFMNLGNAVDLMVEVPAEYAGRIIAGYRAIAVQHAESGAAPPPRLRTVAPADRTEDGSTWRGAFGAPEWAPEQVVARGAELRDGRVVIPPGGEFWFRAAQPFVQFVAEVERLPAARSGVPVLRFVWSKGARLDVISQNQLHQTGSILPIRGWSPEAWGWFGLLLDPAETAPVSVRIAAAKP